MNTSATALKAYDIVVGQVEGSLGKSLHDLVAEVKRTRLNIDCYHDVGELVLYGSALLQEKSPTNKIYFEKDFGKNMLKHWE